MEKESKKLMASIIALLWAGIAGLTWAGQGGSVFEVILSATSTDGRTFIPDPGYRLADGYVDPHVIKVAAGDWLMLVSTTPDSSRRPQRIHMARSSDGITWQVNTNALITVSGGNALDPAAVDLGDGSYRVYYTGTPSMDPFSGFYLTSGVIRATSATDWSFTPDAVSFGISCVSPEALALGGGAVRLYTTEVGGIKAYKANDGLNFTAESGNFPPGSDPSVIDPGHGQMRMYYTTQNASGLKEIDTARSMDGLNWTVEGSTGITNPTTSQAWGVPDSFLDPDGNARLFWVAMPTGLSSPPLFVPVFSQLSGGIEVGKVQSKATDQATNFLQLSDTAWSQYDLIASTAYMSTENEIATVVMDRSSQVPYLTHSTSNSLTDYEALFGLTDLWSTYAVDAAADLDADGYVEYIVRDRATGYTWLVTTDSGANQVKTTGPVLGLDPSALVNYRIEAGGDWNGDGYADLFIRDLAVQLLYFVSNDGAGGYGEVLPLLGLFADTWEGYRVESTGDFDSDGHLDLVVQDSGKTASFKVFGTGSNTYSSYELIP